MRARLGQAAVGLVLVLCACLGIAERRSSACAQDAGTEPAAQAPPAATRDRLVFLMPPLDGGTRAQLESALLGQLALAGIELTLLDDSQAMQRAPNAERAQRAAELAREHAARIVMWLQIEPEGRWTVHMLDAEQRRSASRRLDAASAERAGAVEAIAVLAREVGRESSLVLAEPGPAPGEEGLSREPEPSEAKATEARPQPSVAPDATAEPSVTARLAVGYLGISFAPRTAFNHGIALSGRLDFAREWFAGVRAGWAAPIQPAAPLEVQRVPLGALGGYRLALSQDTFVDAELGLGVELLARSTRPGTPDAVPATSRLRAAAGLSAGLRLEYKPMKQFGFFMSGALEILLTTLRFQAENEVTGEVQTLLAPHWVRPAVEAGVSIYL